MTLHDQRGRRLRRTVGWLLPCGGRGRRIRSVGRKGVQQSMKRPTHRRDNDSVHSKSERGSRRSGPQVVVVLSESDVGASGGLPSLHPRRVSVLVRCPRAMLARRGSTALHSSVGTSAPRVAASAFCIPPRPRRARETYSKRREFRGIRETKMIHVRKNGECECNGRERAKECAEKRSGYRGIL